MECMLYRSSFEDPLELTLRWKGRFWSLPVVRIYDYHVQSLSYEIAKFYV